MSPHNTKWIEEDMKNGLGDIDDSSVSRFIENIRRKGKAYEDSIFQSYLQEIKLHHHPLAYAALGHFYRYGISVTQDYIQAMQNYIKASALGFRPILIHIARRFRLGECVDIDYDRAISCYSSCIDENCDIYLIYTIASEIVKIYCRINDSRFSRPYDREEPGYITMNERKVEAVLDKIIKVLDSPFEYPRKHKRVPDREIYLKNLKKLGQIIDAIDVLLQGGSFNAE